MNSGDVAATDGRAAHPAEGGLEEVSEPRWASGFVWKAGRSPSARRFVVGLTGSSPWKACADRCTGGRM